MTELKRLTEKLDELIKSNKKLTDEQIKQRREYEDQIYNLDEDNIRSITADKINFTTSQFSIYDSADNGNLLFQAGNKNVKIAGFNVDRNSFYHGNTFSSSDLFLCAGGSNVKFNIAGSGSRDGWVFNAGGNFGILNNGTVYASSAVLQYGCIVGNDVTEGEGMQFGASYSDEDTCSSSCKMYMDDISDGYSGGYARGIRFRSYIDRASPMTDDTSSLVINPMGVYFTDEATGSQAGKNGIGLLKYVGGGTAGVGMGYNGVYLWIDGITVCTNATVRGNQTVPTWLEGHFT